VSSSLKKRTYFGIAISILFLVAASRSVSARSQNYNVNLSDIESSIDANGRTVVTMVTRGDLPGTLTLALNTAADGAVTGGEWALIVSYTAVTEADGHLTIGPVDSGSDEAGVADHTEAFVQKGVLKGQVGTGSITRNADGTLSSLSGMSLQVSGGTLDYDQTTTGVGNINGWNLADRNTSNGVLAIAF
jgi:hypothetical protein